MATQTLPETEMTVISKKPAIQYVYFFGGGKADGNGKMKDELGGKGAGLAEMTNAGLPVPRASPFRRKPVANTCGTEACRRKLTAKMEEALSHSSSCKARNSARARIRYW